MGFESGNLSFRIYDLDAEIDENDVGKFAANAAPPIKTLSTEPISGWVGPRHLLDREIRPETCICGDWIAVSLMKAERKIPSALLKAECKIAELAKMAESGLSFLNRATKREIKQRVVEALLPTMPPSLTGIHAVFPIHGHSVFATAMSEKQQDALLVAIKKATGAAAKTVTPESAARRIRDVSAETLPPTVFSPDPKSTALAEGIGLDFMMWLWHFCEAEGGLYKAPDDKGASFGILVEGPLLFMAEGKGAIRASLRDGEPLNSAEAKTAMTAGKKLCSATLLVTRGEDVWSAAVNGSDFSFRNLKLPKIENPDPTLLLHDRMTFVRTFTNVFFGLYDQFLKVRASDSKWNAAVEEMRKWIKNRKANG